MGGAISVVSRRNAVRVAFSLFAELPPPVASSLLQCSTSMSLRSLSLPCRKRIAPCHQELPSTLRSRDPEAFLTKDELVKVVRWKLWMGVVRPNLLRFATETDPKQVRTRAAFASTGFVMLKGNDAGVRAMNFGTLLTVRRALTGNSSESRAT